MGLDNYVCDGCGEIHCEDGFTRCHCGKKFCQDCESMIIYRPFENLEKQTIDELGGHTKNYDLRECKDDVRICVFCTDDIEKIRITDEDLLNYILSDEKYKEEITNKVKSELAQLNSKDCKAMREETEDILKQIKEAKDALRQNKKTRKPRKAKK